MYLRLKTDMNPTERVVMVMNMVKECGQIIGQNAEGLWQETDALYDGVGTRKYSVLLPQRSGRSDLLVSDRISTVSLESV